MMEIVRLIPFKVKVETAILNLGNGVSIPCPDLEDYVGYIFTVVGMVGDNLLVVRKGEALIAADKRLFSVVEIPDV